MLMVAVVCSVRGVSPAVRAAERAARAVQRGRRYLHGVPVRQPRAPPVVARSTPNVLE